MIGFEYVGIIPVEGGGTLPLYRPTTPPDGRPGINTREGWNKVALESNRRSFETVHGRPPVNDGEVTTWARRELAQIIAECGAPEPLPLIEGRA